LVACQNQLLVDQFQLGYGDGDIVLRQSGEAASDLFGPSGIPSLAKIY